MEVGREDRARARCLCLSVGVLLAAGFHMAALRLPSHCTDQNYEMVNINFYWMCIEVVHNKKQKL